MGFILRKKKVKIGELYARNAIRLCVLVCERLFCVFKFQLPCLLDVTSEHSFNISSKLICCL